MNTLSKGTHDEAVFSDKWNQKYQKEIAALARPTATQKNLFIF